MATISSICSFYNTHLGLEPGTAEAYAAELRPAGLLSRSAGGRGKRGGPEATTSDGVVLLLALLSSDTANRASDSAAMFGVFNFAGVTLRSLSDADDRSRRVQPDIEASLDLAPLRQPFAVVLRDVIDAMRAGISDPPGCAFLDITLHRLGSASWASITLGAPADDGGVHFASAIYAHAGEPQPAALATVLKVVAIPATILKALAAFLGPLDDETRADGAVTEAA